MPNTASVAALQPEIWRKELFKDVEDKLYFNVIGAMGQRMADGSYKNGIIHVEDGLMKSRGDRVTIGLGAKLGTLTGVTGDNELEGNESQITYFSESVVLDQWRDAVRLTGRLDEQKAAFNLRSDAKEKLSIRIREFVERQVFLKLGGVTNPTLVDVNGVPYTGTFTDGSNVHAWSNTPDAIPDADFAAGTGARYVNASLTSGGSGLTSTDLITPQLISRAKRKAELATPRILPLEYKGKKYFILWVHPWQMFDLRENATLAQTFREAWWRDDDNPLFSGAELVYDGVIIHEHEYVPFLDISSAGNNFTSATTGEDFGADTFRALLCGQQAVACVKSDRGPRWTEKMFDYDNKWAISAGMLAGIQKIMFNSLEYGVISIDTAATDLS